MSFQASDLAAAPSLAHFQMPKHLEQLRFTLPVRCAAPPTPQDSQASASDVAPSPPPVRLRLPATPVDWSPAAAPASTSDDMEDDIYGKTATASLARRIQPVSVSLGNRRTTQHGKDMAHMEKWLATLPSPMSPEERYICGLDSRVDHPLHPRPLKAPNTLQPRMTKGNDRLIEHLKEDTQDDQDKENEFYLVSGVEKLDMDLSRQGTTRKRHLPEEHTDSQFGRKRTKIFDPVRRFSQRLSSSLSLYPAEEELGERSFLDDLSPADVAKQSEQVYRFSRPPSKARNSIRLSLSRRSGTLHGRAPSTLRRAMLPSIPSTLSASREEGDIGHWTEGRPDMIVNIAFLGDAHVGKTALIRRLVDGTFPQSYEPSDMQQNTVRLLVNGARVELNLSEAGSGRDSTRPSIMALGWYSVVVLCFDIGRKGSLQSLQKYRNDVAMYEQSSVVILAGLKKDARHRLPPLDLSFVEDPVQITTDMGCEMAQNLGCSQYFECSSLSSCEGVDDLYDYIVQSGVELQKARGKKLARFRFENSVDKGMAKIADGVRSLFLFRGAGGAA